MINELDVALSDTKSELENVIYWCKQCDKWIGSQNTTKLNEELWQVMRSLELAMQFAQNAHREKLKEIKFEMGRIA